MLMYHRLFCFLTVMSLCLYHDSLLADTELIYTHQANSVFGNPTIIQIQGSKVRMERNGGQLYLIYDHDTQTLLMVDPKTQTYVVNTLETLRSRTQYLATMQQQFTQQLKQQIEELPLPQRVIALKRLEQAEKMLKIPRPTITVEYEQRTDMILGKPCKIAHFKIRTQLLRTFCYAPHTVINTHDFEQLHALFDFMNQLSEEAAYIQEQPKITVNLSSLIFEASLVLSSHNMVQNTVEELAEIKVAPLDPQLFTIPSNYFELEPSSQQFPIPSLSLTPS